MADITPYLNNIINAIKTDVINSMQAHGQYATGQSINQLETIVDGESGQLLAPFWIWALEFGRKPTSPGAAAGDPTLYQSICIWAAAKGIAEFSTNDKGEKINVWRAITAYIHKNGYPGKQGVLTEPLSDDNVNSRINEQMEVFADEQAKEVLDLFNVFETV
ncbi:MAG: hypothetical protein P4L31_07420 [Candidatus Babeliales bacterium]|nr:hypothetical protein [Candidatus Babeliales bacterium]